jgi:hypothetical protein
MGWPAAVALSITCVSALAGVSYGQGNATTGPAPASATPDTVPRAEYEQLKRDMTEMQRRMDAMETTRRSEDATSANETAAAVRADAEARSRSVFDVRFGDRPNWERPDGWLSPSFRAEEMDLLIGQTPDIDLYMGLQTAGRFQWLEQDDVFIAGTVPGTTVEGPELDPGFQTAWGDLSFLADFGDGDMLVFFDLYISSRPHPSTTYGNEGYMLIRRLPDDSGVSDWLNRSIFKYVTVKAGHFEIDYGDFHYRRSDNAWVQRNPLIGNQLIDPDVEEIGMEIYSKPSPLNWLVGISSGTTTENLNEGRGIASVHGKLWKDWTDDFRTSVSGYYVDHSDNPATGTGSTKGSLFSGRRSGGPYGAVFGGGNAPGEIFVGADQLVTAFQVDAAYMPRPWEFYGHVGWVEDADPNGSLPGSPETSWIYGAAEAVYYFTPRLYAAGRYSLATAQEINGADSDGMAHRIQVGGGYWLTRNVLAKAELVYQTFTDFETADGLVSNVDASEDPSYYGVIFEVSFAF